MISRSRPLLVNVFTVILLEVGMLLFGIGYLIGLWLFITSDAWSLRTKIVGFAIVPGGAIGGFLLVLSIGSRSSGHACVRGLGSAIHTCTSTQIGSSSSTFALIVLFVGVLAPLVVAMRLFLDSAKRRPERQRDEVRHLAARIMIT